MNKIRLKKSLKNVSIRRCKSIVNEFLKSLKPVSMRCYKSKAGEFLTPTNQCKHPESNDRKLAGSTANELIFNPHKSLLVSR